jgi:hypothetical protein
MQTRSNMAFMVELKYKYCVQVGTSCQFFGMVNTQSEKGQNMHGELFTAAARAGVTM